MVLVLYKAGCVKALEFISKSGNSTLLQFSNFARPIDLYDCMSFSINFFKIQTLLNLFVLDKFGAVFLKF